MVGVRVRGAVSGDCGNCNGRTRVARKAPREGKLSWLDEVVQEVISESRAGTRGSLAGDTAHDQKFVAQAAYSSGMMPTSHSSNWSAGQKQLGRGGSRTETVAEGMLETRFSRLLKPDPQAVRTFASLEPAEKQLVVELGETAQQLARRYPQEAETMVRRLGPEGLTAIRVYGDDVAGVLVPKVPKVSVFFGRRAAAAGRSSPARFCPTRRSWPPRGCWPRSSPTPKSLSIRPVEPRNSPSASSPRPVSNWRRRSAAERRAA